MPAIRFVARTYGEFSVVKNSYYLQPGNFHFLQYFRVISISAKSSLFFLSSSAFLLIRVILIHPRVQRFNRAPPHNSEIIYIYRKPELIESQREIVRYSPRYGDRLADPLFIVDWNSKTATPRRGISLKLWLGYWNAAQVRAWRLVYGTWIDSARSLSWHASTCGMYTCAHIRAFVTTPLYNAGFRKGSQSPFEIVEPISRPLCKYRRHDRFNTVKKILLAPFHSSVTRYPTI